jgi:predicted ATPase
MSDRSRVFLREVSLGPDTPTEGFPFELPAVRQLETIDFAPMTVLAGDNGTGKSTIIEALVLMTGFNVEGGGRNLRFSTYDSHSALHEHLVPKWRRQPQWGWFLRAETFYAMASRVALDKEFVGKFPELHGESHGESFLDLAFERFQRPGFYLLDEPESALSMQGQMTLARLMWESIARGSQFVVATHSPFLIAFPAAAIYQFSADGIEHIGYDHIPAVDLWKRFFTNPTGYYERLFSED